MGLTVSAGGSGQEFEKCPAGTHIARCCLIADLGTHESEYKGKKKINKKVVLSWEILEEGVRREDGQPFVVSNTYTASLAEKATLRAMLDGWRGTPFTPKELDAFELGKVMGAYAQITIIHEVSEKDPSKVYANIASVAALHKAIPRPDPVNENIVFNMDAQGYFETFEKLPKWIKEKVELSPEWKGKTAGPEKKAVEAPASDDSFQDDMPF